MCYMQGVKYMNGCASRLEVSQEDYYLYVILGLEFGGEAYEKNLSE